MGRLHYTEMRCEHAAQSVQHILRLLPTPEGIRKTPLAVFLILNCIAGGTSTQNMRLFIHTSIYGMDMCT